ncbi:MAG TPA: hypothetical protein P5511_03315, partial [Candidatus Goldiibacteriota bacterium]|nr:hypothetical protein [Candidatus Goldiibacteriota bacterium]
RACVDMRYFTSYNGVEAIYGMKAWMAGYANPYPFNIFGANYGAQNYEASGAYSGMLEKMSLDTAVKYSYLDTRRDYSGLVYIENRLSVKASAERDFDFENGRKVKALFSVDTWFSDISAMGKRYWPAFNIEAVLKGIFYLEPFVFQGGFRIQDYNLHKNFYRMSPYLSADWDALPYLGLYAEFKPKMGVVDTFEYQKTPFVALNEHEMEAENASARAGARINVFETFVDAYYGYRSVRNNMYPDTVTHTASDMSRVFVIKNNDIDTAYAGISVETVNVKDIKVRARYEYLNIIKQSRPANYLPLNTASIDAVYSPAEWEFGVSASLKSAYLGAAGQKAPASAVLDLFCSRKINDNLTVAAHANNILNNTHYLLYYYEEKGFSAGVSAVLKF